ncbi:MAG: carboxypeptidase-like regulatory domain-containing protein [Paludibacteraceae bacterium]
MKTTKSNLLRISILPMLGLFFALPDLTAQQADTIIYTYRGVVTDEKNESLPYAVLSVEKSSISTVTNSDGEFVLKVPQTEIEKSILVSFLGHENLRIPLSSLRSSDNRFRLKASAVALPDLEVVSKDPNLIVQNMMANTEKNYSRHDEIMTAFYRETIKKRNTNVSLSEAIVEVYKRAYGSNLHDMAALYKSRKSTDYNRLDTLVFKLMGGPFNNIYLDAMRYPEFIFTTSIFDNYEFTFINTDIINDRIVYVLGFKQLRHVAEPLFYGKLFIDAETYALARAEFDMDLKNNDEATRIFVRKKPFNARTSVTKAQYVLDYRLMDNVWRYAYSRVELGLKINWKRRLFNTYYNTNIEMAATDWTDNADRKSFRAKDRIVPSVVIQDETSGFGDVEFWGEYNIIEPDKSIDSAIEKIRKQLDKGLR